MEECEGASIAQKGNGTSSDERLRAQKLAAPAVTGATWGERNRVMESLFEERRAADPGAVPAYRPPGTPIEKDWGPR